MTYRLTYRPVRLNVNVHLIDHPTDRLDGFRRSSGRPHHARGLPRVSILPELPDVKGGSFHLSRYL